MLSKAARPTRSRLNPLISSFRVRMKQNITFPEKQKRHFNSQTSANTFCWLRPILLDLLYIGNYFMRNSCCQLVRNFQEYFNFMIHTGRSYQSLKIPKKIYISEKVEKNRNMNRNGMHENIDKLTVTNLVKFDSQVSPVFLFLYSWISIKSRNKTKNVRRWENIALHVVLLNLWIFNENNIKD